MRRCDVTDENWSGRQRIYMRFLEALAQIKEEKPGHITRRWLQELSSIQLLHRDFLALVDHPTVVKLRKRIGLVRLDPGSSKGPRSETPESKALGELYRQVADQWEREEQLLRARAEGASNLGKKGAAARNSYFEAAKEKLRRIWAQGNYRTKKDCVKQNYRQVGLKWRTAVGALNGEPNPDPWPARRR